MTLNLSLLETLTNPGSRLPWLKRWLLEEIWSAENYNKLSCADYLINGETNVNKLEAIITASADRIYHELLSASLSNKKILGALSDPDTAVVVFDGLSVREIPILIKLSNKSGLTVQEVDCQLAAIPSESIDFIERELDCGRIAPSQIRGRRELKSKGITASYTNNITQPINIDDENSALLVWSSFPDNTYTDSGARFESHFENIHVQFETAWINTIQQIRNKKRIIITSDHGYIFLGAGMDAPRTPQELKQLNAYFGNDRYVMFSEKPDPPESDDIVIDTNKHVAMIKGRVKTRSSGEAATKLYKHGGLSLMEMFTPWIVLDVK